MRIETSTMRERRGERYQSVPSPESLVTVVHDLIRRIRNVESRRKMGLFLTRHAYHSRTVRRRVERKERLKSSYRQYLVWNTREKRDLDLHNMSILRERR